MRFALLLALIFCAAGCDDGECDCAASSSAVVATSAEAPSMTSDAPDVNCQVILREAGRVPTDEGFATDADGWQYVEGIIDVHLRSIYQSASVHLLYKRGGEWRHVEAVESFMSAVESDYYRYFFRTEGLIDTSLSMDEQLTTEVEMAAYLEIPGVGRVFDHNRLLDLNENYVLDQSTSWRVDMDEYVCSPLEPDPTDIADRDCQLVLRTLNRVPYQDDYLVDEDGYYVWEGFIDVAQGALEDGTTVHAMYERGDPWPEVEATAYDDPTTPVGYERFRFYISSYTMHSGATEAAQERTTVDVVVFLRTANGDRLFDHNRMTGQYDNYELTVDNDWSVEDDSAICYPGT